MAKTHGLRAAALGLTSGVVIGVASTAPAYSLAVTLGSVSRELGAESVAAPAVLLLAVIPVLCIAVAFDRLNRWQSDCGTTFAWVAQTMGPWLGWAAGWVTVAAGALVIASLAQVAALYAFHLLGLEGLAQSRTAVVLAGVGWILSTTWVCVRGIEATARMQCTLLAVELAALVVFGVAALLASSGAGAPADAVRPSLSWFGFGTIHDSSALAGAVSVAIFLYWGWESALSLNEETRNPQRTPGRAAYLSLGVLLLTYVFVAVAAQMVHGPAYLAEHAEDVFSALAPQVLPAPWDRLITFAVLVSAVAACQTTLLPTARTLLSMAAAGALPARMARIHPVFGTPSLSTWILGGVSCAWFVAVSLASPNVLAVSLDSLGLLITFYYAITGYACPLAYARTAAWRGMRQGKEALLLFVAPFAGAAALTWVFVRLCVSFVGPASPATPLGMAPPLALVAAVFGAGAVLALARFRAAPAFFLTPLRPPS